MAAMTRKPTSADTSRPTKTSESHFPAGGEKSPIDDVDTAIKKVGTPDIDLTLPEGFCPPPYTPPLQALPRIRYSPVDLTRNAAEEMERRLAELDEFARKNPGQPISGKAVELFPELAAVWEASSSTPPPLPEKAPAKWARRENKAESPPDFIRRVYGTWMGRGLARSDILRFDEPLYRALYNWMKANQLPEWLYLPTRREMTDLKAKQYGIAKPGDTAPTEAENDERFRVMNSLKQRTSYRAKNGKNQGMH